MTGDLSIKGTTNPVSLPGHRHLLAMRPRSKGAAEATVLRGDFGIGIPNAPSVADVSEEVLIRLEFVATSV